MSSIDRPALTPSSSVDDVDLDVIAALQIAPRITAKALAEVLNEPAATITRRLKKLQDTGTVRVIGRFDWPLVATGNPMQMWICCSPGQARNVTERLKAFPEVQYLVVTSGGADIFVTLFPLVGSDLNELMSDRIPSIPGVVSMQSQLVLKSTSVGQDWRLNRLTPHQRAEIEAVIEPVGLRPFTSIDELSEIEFKTMRELGGNARASAATIARKLGLSHSTAYRAIQTLIGSGALTPRVEVEPAAVGFPLGAIVSLQVAPHSIPQVMSGLSNHASARMVTMVAGSASVIHNGVFAGPADLADFITDDIGALPGVDSINVSVILQVFRRYWMDRDGMVLGPQVEGVLRR